MSYFITAGAELVTRESIIGIYAYYNVGIPFQMIKNTNIKNVTTYFITAGA
jgi:hypothetical protein